MPLTLILAVVNDRLFLSCRSSLTNAQRSLLRHVDLGALCRALVTHPNRPLVPIFNSVYRAFLVAGGLSTLQSCVLLVFVSSCFVLTNTHTYHAVVDPVAAGIIQPDRVWNKWRVDSSFFNTAITTGAGPRPNAVQLPFFIRGPLHPQAGATMTYLQLATQATFTAWKSLNTTVAHGLASCNPPTLLPIWKPTHTTLVSLSAHPSRILRLQDAIKSSPAAVARETRIRAQFPGDDRHINKRLHEHGTLMPRLTANGNVAPHQGAPLQQSFVLYRSIVYFAHSLTRRPNIANEEARIAAAYIGPHSNGETNTPCRSCRMRHLKLLSFNFQQSVSEVPAHVVGLVNVPRKASQAASVTVTSETVPVSFSWDNRPEGCVCRGLNSVFYSPIYDPITHSALFSSHLSLCEMLVIVMVPPMFKQIKSSATMCRSSAPFPFSPAAAQRISGSNHDYGSLFFFHVFPNVRLLTVGISFHATARTQASIALPWRL